MCAMELKDERQRRRIRSYVRRRETMKLRKVLTNEMYTRRDAGEKGALADSISTRKLPHRV